MNKKKILFQGDFSDYKFEGFMKIVDSLESGLSKDFKIIKNSRSKKIDLINIHSSGFLNAFNYDFNCPSVYSLHSNFKINFFQDLNDQIDFYRFISDSEEDYYPFSQKIKKISYRSISILTPTILKRNLFKKFSRVIVPSQFMKKVLKLDNVEVINHGIDTKKFKPIKRKKSSKISIAYFGHLSTSKGIIEVVSVFSTLKGIRKRIYVTNITEKFKRFVKDIDSEIEIVGVVKDIVKEYNKNDILFFPYRHIGGAIGTPLVVIEAMSCGRAIVTSDLPHLREYCADSVVYVRPSDLEDMKKKIDSLINNEKKRLELGKKARGIARKKFDKDLMIKKYKKIYEELIS